MSQIYKSLASGPVPPAVPTQFNTDVNSPSIPIANVENVLGGTISTNNNNGVQTDGSSGSNTLTVQLTNRITATLTTNDATITPIITFTLPAIAGTYYVYGNIQAYSANGPSGASYSFSGGYLTNGVATTELGTEFHDTFQSASLINSDIFLSASGNAVLVTVQGVVGFTIDWNALLEFRQVN